MQPVAARPRPAAEPGFTLVELMVVIAIIAIIAAIAIPNLLAARLQANEAAAIATMRSIATAQSQFQTSARVDVDRDGVGEHGLFRELTGAAGLRTTGDGSALGAALRPAALSGSFATLNSDGEVTRSGFHFKVFLPNAQGRAVSESSLSALEASGAAVIDSDLAETTWCAYAWPARGGATGTHTFFVSQRGDITRSEREPALRSGPNGIEVSEAGYAFVAGGGPASQITGVVAYGALGRDGKVWRRVN